MKQAFITLLVVTISLHAFAAEVDKKVTELVNSEILSYQNQEVFKKAQVMQQNSSTEPTTQMGEINAVKEGLTKQCELNMFQMISDGTINPSALSAKIDRRVETAEVGGRSVVYSRDRQMHAYRTTTIIKVYQVEMTLEVKNCATSCPVQKISFDGVERIASGPCYAYPKAQLSSKPSIKLISSKEEVEDKDWTRVDAIYGSMLGQ